VWVLSGFGKVGRNGESGKKQGNKPLLPLKVGKNKGINPFFPCICVCKGRRRTMLFKMTLFQRFFFFRLEKN
jgi:hypothetical protein